MRQVHDMQTSLSATIALYAGALAVAFGLGMLLSSGGSLALWGGVALAGVVAVAVGAVQRRPAQRAAYENYLKNQETRDLQEVKKDTMDEESLALIKAELKRRKA